MDHNVVDLHLIERHSTLHHCCFELFFEPFVFSGIML